MNTFDGARSRHSREGIRFFLDLFFFLSADNVSAIHTGTSKNHVRNENAIKSYPRVVNLVSRID
jgi:hypothetical protein